jgi:hypothetical protein
VIFRYYQLRQYREPDQNFWRLWVNNMNSKTGTGPKRDTPVRNSPVHKKCDKGQEQFVVKHETARSPNGWIRVDEIARGRTFQLPATLTCLQQSLPGVQQVCFTQASRAIVRSIASECAAISGSPEKSSSFFHYCYSGNGVLTAEPVSGAPP